MRMNTSIPMMGQQPDIVNVLRQANVAGQERRDFDRTNALRAMLMEQGPGIMAGEQNALAALAQYDPQAALGVQDTRLGMDQTRLSMDLARRQDGRQAQESQMRLRVLGRQEAAAIEQEAAQRTAAEREQARRELAITMTALNNAQSPQEWDQIASGLDPSLVGSFQNRQMIIAGLQDTDEIIAGLTGGQEDPTSAMQNYNFMISQGVPEDQALARAFSGGVTVNTGNVPDTRPQIGTPPAGYQYNFDPATNSYVAQAIPGGPEDTTQQAAARAGSRETMTSVITNAAQRAIEANNNRLAGGLLGRAAAQNPSSWNAELQRQVDVLKSNATIESLNAMRRESPTGGALGSVTQSENAMLAARVGALDPASPNFQRDLLDYTRELYRVVHGFEEGSRRFNQEFGAQAPSQQSFQPVEQSPQTAPTRGDDLGRFSGMSMQELMAFDMSTATMEDLQAWNRAVDALEGR